jgi:hypothetical protein
MHDKLINKTNSEILNRPLFLSYVLVKMKVKQERQCTIASHRGAVVQTLMKQKSNKRYISVCVYKALDIQREMRLRRISGSTIFFHITRYYFRKIYST